MYSKEMIWGKPIKPLPFKLIVQNRDEIWRAADWWMKEPETIKWIDSFEENTVFWDIGANIGVFSLYNSMRGGNRSTIAWEPGRLNFNRMIENVRINEILSPLIYKCDAVGDFDGKTEFFIPENAAGASGGQILQPVGPRGMRFRPAESYQVDVFKMDTLADIYGVPDYIKIDVDGCEWEILQGAAVMLGNPGIKSVLVEVNKSNADIVGYMKSYGFTDFNIFNAEDVNKSINSPTHNTIFTR